MGYSMSMEGSCISREIKLVGRSLSLGQSRPWRQLASAADPPVPGRLGANHDPHVRWYGGYSGRLEGPLLHELMPATRTREANGHSTCANKSLLLEGLLPRARV